MQVITYSYMGLVHADGAPRFPSIKQVHLPDCGLTLCGGVPRVLALARRVARRGVARLSGLVRRPVQNGACPTDGVVGGLNLSLELRVESHSGITKSILGSRRRGAAK